MDLKNIGNVFQHHYEKVILGLALVGLAAAVFILRQSSQAEQTKIQTYIEQVERRSGALVKPADLTNMLETLAKATNPPPLKLSEEHNLFNPVKWQRRADGGWVKQVKGTEGTVDELEILRIAPLQFMIYLDKYTGSGYTITITNEAAYPRRISGYYTLNDTNKPLLVLREIKGMPDNPSELVLELKENGERIVVSREQPFIRTNTYEADLKWKVENKPFNRQRVNSVLRLGTEEYKIVAINPGEVVVSAPNDKKYTVRQPSAQQ